MHFITSAILLLTFFFESANITKINIHIIMAISLEFNLFSLIILLILTLEMIFVIWDKFIVLHLLLLLNCAL